jgi:eukaryotic-like serine/threonine-protein kinase
MALEAGTQLGHYEITGQLGKGGMGEVYRALDTRLGREVAVKVLPEEFARDEERLARLEREARMLAALNHSNIATIYGLEQSDETRFLVLELVEGDTLADRLRHGAIPVEESLKLALQIAEALEAAHEKGVIHRDLKPANIKITPEGRVKVLDFGLAKAFIGEPGDVNLSHSPTLSMAATQQGIILGTAAYMSPEQAEGEAADSRSDIWAFGVVLFEMLTGRQVFDGKTATRVLAAVLHKEPDWDSLPGNLHPRIRTLLDRLLDKERRDRLSTISDARVEIQRVLADPGGAVAKRMTARVEPVTGSRVPWVAALVLTAVVAIAGTWLLRPLPAQEYPIVRWDYTLPEGQNFRIVNRGALAISPDATSFVYNGVGGLYLRSMSESGDRLIAGTELPQSDVAFSPDGEWLAFFSTADSQVKKVAVVGGVAVTLAASPGLAGISWDTDDVILYTQADGVWQVSADGGQPELVIAGDKEGYGTYPQLLPGSDAILTNPGGGATALGGQIAVYEISSGASKMLFPGSRARYVRTGHIVYAQGNVLFAVPFDLKTLEVTGGPVPLVEGVQAGPPQYAISDNGWLVYVPGTTGTAPDGILAFADRSGNRTPLDLSPDQYRSPRVSPDGTRIAVEIVEEDGSSDIWVYNLAATSAIRRLTNQGSNTRPIWTPDGERVTYASDRDGAWGIYWQKADGSDVAERLIEPMDGASLYPESWSPDMATLSYAVVQGDWDLWTFSLSSGESELFLDTANNEFGSVFSPDGRWLAYSRTDFQPFRVQVQPFPPTGVEFDVLQDGETWPVWSPDGSALFARLNLALQQSVEIRAMDIDTEGTFSYGNASALPMRGALVFQNYRDYDVHPDGDRFLMIFSPDESSSGPPPRPRISIVENWAQELLRRVPVD